MAWPAATWLPDPAMCAARRVCLWFWLNLGLGPGLTLASPFAVAAPAAAMPALQIYGMESKPVSFVDGGKPAGMVVELAREIQRRLGRQDEIAIIPWARANELGMSQSNVLLLSIVRTPQREGRLRFVGPLFSANIAGFALKGRGAALLALGDGLYKLRAGARRGSIFVEQARRQGYNLVDETNSSETAARMLVAHRFDLWFDGEEIVMQALAKAGYGPDTVERVVRLGTQDVYFAFSAGTPDSVLLAWDTALRAMKHDGSYQRILHKWLPAQAPLPQADLSPAR